MSNFARAVVLFFRTRTHKNLSQAPRTCASRESLVFLVARFAAAGFAGNHVTRRLNWTGTERRGACVKRRCCWQWSSPRYAEHATVVSRDRSFSEPTIEVERTIHASPLSGDNSATISTREGCTHLNEYRRRLELTTYRVASPTPANGCQALESLHSTCFLARISTFDDCSFGPYECKYLFILQVLQSFRINE